MNQDWIPLLDYAVKTGVSLSTLRRHIKAGKIRYRIEEGRYLLPANGNLGWNGEPSVSMGVGATAYDWAGGAPPAGTFAADELNDRTIDLLRAELRQARKELAELKTLVAFYEEGASAVASKR